MKTILWGLLPVLAVLEGCATTGFYQITTHVAPGTRYQKIIVHSDLADSDTRKTVEDAVVREFQAIGVSATPSYTIFPSTTTYTWAVKKRAIQADGFDAGLLVKVVNSYSTSTPKGFNDSNWNQAGTIDPGEGNFNTAHFEIETKLVETKNFTAVWKAETGSEEGMDASGDFSLGKMMDSYALTLVGELQSEGVITAASNLESIGR